MHFKSSSVLLLLCAAHLSPCAAQDVGRVSPAALPLPLPSSTPMPPDQLRAHNPWNLPMTGTWRFRLTHGRIVSNEFQVAAPSATDITASSNEEKNAPVAAFDGSTDTRWCASDSSYPQWLQADLGKTRRVSAISLAWEFAGDTYRCQIEGRTKDDGPWQMLADDSAAPGIGNGPVALKPADVRYIRITVLGNNGTNWASIREFQIKTVEGGNEIAWSPPAAKPLDNSPSVRDAFAATGFNDADWDKIPVPSNWEMLGYSLPTYNAVDNTVGMYRRVVTVPATWAGKQIFWHFDGALDGTEVFINGKKAGYHESGYTAWNIDLTGLLKIGHPNLFAVRVSKTTPSDDCETGDFQCMGGIYRDNSLIAVPPTHVTDIIVRTPLAANYRDASLVTQIQVQGRPGQALSVTGTLFSMDGHATTVKLAGSGRVAADGQATLALNAPVKEPKLWSAEKPNLYYVVYQVASSGKAIERVEQRFGFRQIEIKNNIVLWNGRPIKCTGSCRHDFWADKGFALTDTEWNKDLTLMKAANINAIRTSHYNHAARFLELCEERGMYILDEVPYCWIGDQVKDPKYAPYLIQRAQETLARDKNRPCVLAWSIGNENPAGPDSQQVIDLVKKTDPTRPAFVSSVNPGDISGQSWDDEHYPDPSQVDRVAANPKWGANFSEHPHIFYQKETQDYDPGASDLWSEALIKTWDKLWNDPTILGSFIWEWQNQGIADKNANKTQDLWYGPDHLRQENNKGIVSAYRVPKPEWWIVHMVYSKVVVGARTVSPIGGACIVPITNHYSFTDLQELTCHWTALAGATALKRGVTHVACAPMQSVQASFPAPAGMTMLRLDFENPDETSVVTANLAVDGAPLPAPPPALSAGGVLAAQDSADTLSIKNDVQEIVFDKRSGSIQSWRVSGKDVLTGGPVLNLGEAKASDEKSVYRAPQPPITDNAQVTASPVGANGSLTVMVASRVLTGPGGTQLGTFACTYNIKPNAQIGVIWSMDWTAPDIDLWEEGLKFSVPTGLSRMTWQRDSYFTDYPAGHLGEPVGVCSAGDTLFRASKRGLHWLTLTDKGGDGVALLAADTPLVGRADVSASGSQLSASREVAGPHDFSGSWVSDHDIHAAKGKPLGGSFTLRAVGVKETNHP